MLLSMALMNAVIYGFNVNLSSQVKQLASRAHVEVRLYKIIYELLDDAKNTMSSLLPDEVVETPLGELEVQGVFRTTKTNIIAGGKVTEGRLLPHTQARIWRGKGKKAEQLGEVELVSLRREKNEASDIVEGEMCGVGRSIRSFSTRVKETQPIDCPISLNECTYSCFSADLLL